MTVAELIEQLKKMPEENVVLMDVGFENLAEVRGIVSRQLVTGRVATVLSDEDVGE